MCLTHWEEVVFQTASACWKQLFVRVFIGACVCLCMRVRGCVHVCFSVLLITMFSSCVGLQQSVYMFNAFLCMRTHTCIMSVSLLYGSVCMCPAVGGSVDHLRGNHRPDRAVCHQANHHGAENPASVWKEINTLKYCVWWTDVWSLSAFMTQGQQHHQVFILPSIFNHVCCKLVLTAFSKQIVSYGLPQYLHTFFCLHLRVSEFSMFLP